MLRGDDLVKPNDSTKIKMRDEMGSGCEHTGKKRYSAMTVNPINGIRNVS